MIWFIFLFIGLETNEFMEIRRSCIDNRFYGAFASKDIAVNTVIGQYKGVICNKNDSLSQYKHSIGRDVVIIMKLII